jgi:hypothetical protein
MDTGSAHTISSSIQENDHPNLITASSVNQVRSGRLFFVRIDIFYSVVQAIVKGKMKKILLDPKIRECMIYIANDKWQFHKMDNDKSPSIWYHDHHETSSIQRKYSHHDIIKI